MQLNKPVFRPVEVLTLGRAVLSPHRSKERLLRLGTEH
jgi:hypothetical protein